MSASSILVEISPPVATVTLNRPEVMNAWDRPMRDALLAALLDLDAREDVGAIVITGAGDAAFCAGQDLNEAKNFDPDRAVEWIEEWQVLYNGLRSLSKPTIAALNGVAAGSAFQFALLCDIRIGHPGIALGQPEIKSGIVSVLGIWIMREVMGLGRAAELALTARLVDGKTALDFGLLTELVEAGRLQARARELASELAAMPPEAMRLTKKWLQQIAQPEMDRAFEAAIDLHRDSYSTGEPQRESAAFIDRRKQRRAQG